MSDETSQKLKRILKKKGGWDGGKATDFDPDWLAELRELISLLSFPPAVYPTTLPSVQLEYGGPGMAYLTIEVRKTQMAEVYQSDPDGHYHYGQVLVDANRINELVRRFFKKVGISTDERSA